MGNRTAVLAALLMGVFLAGCNNNEEPSAGDATVAPAPDPNANAIVDVAPGRYASDAMVLVLNPNASFSIIRHGQVDGFDGAYTISGTIMALTDATGGDGSLVFPMECSVSEMESGFALSGDGCGLTGQAFVPTAG